jgi:type I restriction enzyme, R subunit
VKPEEKARQGIDKVLEAAGWVLQDMKDFNRKAALGVAVREFQTNSGPCDYLLLVDGKAAGVIEAKPAGVTLSGVADQSEKYMVALPDHVAKWDKYLRFDYESTGDETFFRDMSDPKPRSRRIFAFHKPETLLEWLKQSKPLRSRLNGLPPLDERGLRDCQIEAIHGLEKALAEDRPRSLIQMATGAGKTFTACTFSHRLIKYGGAKRILFLVDRNNLGDQTLKEFQNFDPPGTGHRFTDTYIVHHLGSNRIDPDAKVVITTIQRLYSMLKGEELDPENEEASSFETWETEEGEIPPITYNPAIPLETFDFIITDECHRSIYGLWRQVLDYFDAFIIGLTATPSKHTLGFFNKNLVAEYPYERSVADGVNVGYEVFRIRTQVSEEGGKVEAADYQVPVRDRRTRSIRYKKLDEDLEYAGTELDRSVTTPNQIRAIIQCYKDKLFTELFPGRTGEWVPKTLIFAKDDNHAEEIVHIVREIFDEGNDFCKKITYRVTGEDPKTIIKSFRVDPSLRIAVTVDMIATGTDIKPVEVIFFMRDVKSEGYYEQMKGRGVRSIPDSDLLSVTPDAKTKTRFVLIDAVGVTEGKKNVSQPLERNRAIAFDKLIDQIAQGRRDENAISSLASRLAALDHKLEGEDKARITEASGGKTLRDLANGLLDAIDPDKIEAIGVTQFGRSPEENEASAIQEELTDKACDPFNDPKLRQLIKDIKQKSDIVIDEITTDTVTGAGYDLNEARKRIDSFKEFIETHKDELTALQILYNQPYGKQKLTYAAIKELVQKLTDPPVYLTTADVWQAYKRLDAARVKGAPVDQQLTEIVSLVRYTLGMEKVLEPFGVKVEQRFNLWIGRQKKAGREFSEEQLGWLRSIAGFIAANAEIHTEDFMNIPSFADKGGLLKARELFGPDLNTMMDDLQLALVG